MIGILFLLTRLPHVKTVLAIETSSPEASIALWSDGAWLFEAEFLSDRSHNCMVFEPLASALAALEGRDLSCVVVGTGPGSYSGTRIGIAAAQGVAIAKSCPVAGLGSLAATPAAYSKTTEKPVMAIGDARRGLYYLSTIIASGEASEPELMDAETLKRRLAEAADHDVFTLDEPAKLGLDEDVQMGIRPSRPDARLLLELWLELDSGRQQELLARPLAPTYLRAPFTSKAKPGHPLLRKG